MAIIVYGNPKRKKPMLDKPVRPNKQIEMKGRALLEGIAQRLKVDVEGLADFYDSPRMAFDALSELLTRYDSVLNSEMIEIANKWVTDVSDSERIRLSASIAKALGVDVTHILDTPAVGKAVELAQYEAQMLIKSIPVRMVGDVSRYVLDNFKGIPMPEGRSLTDQIQEVCQNTRYRARLIARDQTSKMTTALNQVRQTECGIEEYVWRTAGDRRVVGTPGGKWDKPTAVHGNHYERDKKTFRWDTPPEDGAPGYAINCRCVAIPIIDPDKLIL